MPCAPTPINTTTKITAKFFRLTIALFKILLLIISVFDFNAKVRLLPDVLTHPLSLDA